MDQVHWYRIQRDMDQVQVTKIYLDQLQDSDSYEPGYMKLILMDQLQDSDSYGPGTGH